jgi:hypothetical protein
MAEEDQTQKTTSIQETSLILKHAPIGILSIIDKSLTNPSHFQTIFGLDKSLTNPSHFQTIFGLECYYFLFIQSL